MKNLQRVLSQQSQPLNVIYLSSYIPRKCGIATYTKDLTNAVNLLNSRSLAEILSISRADENFEYPWEAKFKIVRDDLGTYLDAADYVNHSHADVVSLQHEFGLFGGECGEYILHFAEALHKPLVTTLHTVLTDTSDKHKEVIQRLASKSHAVVVMMGDGAAKLTKHYGIPRKKIVVVPHGVPDFPFNATEKHKRKHQVSDRLVLGNINLLHPQKGIEYALQAVALIARHYPQVLYMVIGQTHPDFIRENDEQYRNSLRRLIRELKITNNVRFVNEYLPLKDVVDWLKTIDIYITPYLDPQQITSGALAYAIGAGKACVSTPYVYSKEVLADGRGILVPFRDPTAIAAAVLDLWEHPEKKQAIERRTYEFGRLMTWPNVAQSYLNLFRAVQAKHSLAVTHPSAAPGHGSRDGRMKRSAPLPLRQSQEVGRSEWQQPHHSTRRG